MERKRPPAQVATGGTTTGSCNWWHHHRCKTCLCQWLKEKCHRRNFQPVTTTMCASGVILLSTSTSTPLAHMVVVTGCNLRRWHFPSAIGANTPCTGSGATRCNLRWWSFFYPLEHMQCCRCRWWLSVVVIYTYIYICHLQTRASTFLAIGCFNRECVQTLSALLPLQSMCCSVKEDKRNSSSLYTHCCKL